MKVLFACTSLCRNSTIIKDYAFISANLNKSIPDYKTTEKQIFILFKTEFPDAQRNIIESRNGISTLARNYINTPELKTLDMNITDFTEKVDVLVLTQCSNLIQTFVNKLNSKTNILELIEKIIKIYNLIEEGGYIVNFYYTLDEKNEITLANVEDFYSEISITHFLFHIYLVDVFKILFEKISTGIYKKRKIDDIETILILNYSEVYGLYESIYKEMGKEELALIILKTHFKKYLSLEDKQILLKKRINTIFK